MRVDLPAPLAPTRPVMPGPDRDGEVVEREHGAVVLGQPPRRDDGRRRPALAASTPVSLRGASRGARHLRGAAARRSRRRRRAPARRTTVRRAGAAPRRTRRATEPGPIGTAMPAPTAATCAALTTLVEGEDGHHDLGHARRERAHGGAEAAVPDHRRGVGEHVVLGQPLLDAGVRGPGREVGGVDASADGHQHPGVEVGQAVQRLAEHAVEVPERAGDRAERHVDQRAVGVAPTGRSAPVDRRGLVEAQVRRGLGGRSPAAWSSSLGHQAEHGLGRQRRVRLPVREPGQPSELLERFGDRAGEAVGTTSCMPMQTCTCGTPGALGGRPGTPARPTRAARRRVASARRSRSRRAARPGRRSGRTPRG